MQKELCTTVLTLRETFQMMVLFEVACTQTLFYFSFRKHRQAREKKKERLFSSSPTPTSFLFITRARRTLKRK